ncbi:hypothetical protein LY78DRAFT_540624, partial [Colletotrichum sublineola]
RLPRAEVYNAEAEGAHVGLKAVLRHTDKEIDGITVCLNNTVVIHRLDRALVVLLQTAFLDF